MLQGRLQRHKLTARRLRIAVGYLPAELPLFLDAAAIAGQSASVFCYHTWTGFLGRLYARALPVKPADRQGFAVVISPRLK